MATSALTNLTATPLSLFEKMKSSLSDLSSKVTEISKKAFSALKNTFINIGIGVAAVIFGTVYVAFVVSCIALSVLITISPIAFPVLLIVALLR